MTLYMHELHKVEGAHEHEFEAAYRGGWLTTLAEGDDARLLWYLNQAHGSGPAYHVVTMTAVRDGAAYERLARRIAGGDLHDWFRSVSAMRHEVDAKMLRPVSWSPLQNIDLDEVPTDGREHELSLYMQDTGWPTAPLDDYIGFWDTDYYRIMKEIPEDSTILRIEACFGVAHGTGYRPEAMLMQKILNYGMLQNLISEPEKYDPDSWPGSYMHGGLELRDQWESKLLRTSNWSPLY